MAIPFFIHSSTDELNSNLPPNRDHRATLRLGDGAPLVAQILLYRGGGTSPGGTEQTFWWACAAGPQEI